jgi:Uma2 family endonuclease
MVLFERARSTDAEFEARINAPENADKWFEMIKGVIYEVVMPSPLHATIALLIASLLRVFVTERRLGNVVGDGCLFHLPNGDKVIPDAAYISKERSANIPSDYYRVAPDLAVEVVSPSNKPDDILDKVESYIECGTRLVWVFYPEEQFVRVWRPTDNGRTSVEKLDINGTLDGEDVLPGFSVSVKDIFPVEQT